MRSALLAASLVALAAADEVASPVACGIAATLMGTVFVIMILYYLFNWPDPDIRKYSYDTVSSTVSIFCAVLLFQSFQNTVDYFMDGQPLGWCIFVAFAHRFFWHAFLQISLAYITKSICHSDKVRADIISEEEGGREKFESCELWAKCVGLLLAHMTGFAWIAAWGTVQQAPWFAQNWYFSWLVVPASFITNIPLLKLTDCVRDKIASSGDPDDVDKLETMWNEVVADAENDITALGVSFLTVQSVKFLICGTLANVEGEEDEELTYGHSVRDCVLLYLFGTICIPIFCAVKLKLAALEEGEEKEAEEKEEEAKNRRYVELTDEERAERKEKQEEEKEAAEKNEKFARNLDIICATFVMGMAWSYFYATKWALGAMPLNWGGNAQILTLSEAVVSSTVCFSCIFVLDKLADADWTSDKADECIKCVISAIGVFVGFAWEQAFDAGVAALGSNTPRPVLTKQLMAIACALVVVPAWRLHIAPVIFQEGWRFGFIASHVTKYVDDEDEEGLMHYFKQLEHLCTGHRAYKENTVLKRQLIDLLKGQLHALKDEDEPYHQMPELADTGYIPLLGGVKGSNGKPNA